MDVKIDTKEKFTVITPNISYISANMTDQLLVLLLPYLQKDVPHIVLKMCVVEKIDNEIAEKIADTQQTFYDNNASFVICEINDSIEEQLDKMELLETMNITPTESEAWDIVQMEEIERELLDDL